MDNGHRVVVIIEDENNPFEIWVLGALLLSGMFFLLGLAPPPQSIEAVLPEFSRWLWCVQITTGSILTLVCMLFLKNSAILRRKLQVAGYVQVATGAIIYSCAIFYFGGAGGLAAGSIVASVALSAMFRAFQINRQTNKLLDRFEGRPE